MGKLMDWKGALFWNCYYGAWIYAWFKNGRPGTIQQNDPKLSASATLAKKATVVNDLAEKATSTTATVVKQVKNVTEPIASNATGESISPAVAKEATAIVSSVTETIIHQTEEFTKDALVVSEKVATDVINEVQEIVNDVATELKPVVKEVVKEAPLVAEIVLKEAQEISFEIAHEVPHVAEKVIFEVEEVAAMIPEDLKTVVDKVKEMTVPLANTVSGMLEQPIQTSIELPKVIGSSQMDIFWAKTDMVLDWFSTAFNPGDSGILAEGALAGLNSWPQCTGLSEWQHSSDQLAPR